MARGNGLSVLEHVRVVAQTRTCFGAAERNFEQCTQNGISLNGSERLRQVVQRINTSRISQIGFRTSSLQEAKKRLEAISFQLGSEPRVKYCVAGGFV